MAWKDAYRVRGMTAKQKMGLDDVTVWYLGFLAHFSDLIFDHRDDRDQWKTVHRLAEYCDDWEKMSPSLPMNAQAGSALDMFSECVHADQHRSDGFDGFDQLAERCSSLFIDRARMLTKNEKSVFALQVATMFDGHFGSSMFERMLTEVVGPRDVGDVLDIISRDLFFRFRDSDDIVIEAVDRRYHELAERLIEAAGRSSRGNLKGKLTIRIR